MADAKEKAAFHLTLTLDTLECLGFLVNYDKSILVPTQRIEFLGIVVNSASMEIPFPQKKVLNIMHEARNLLASEAVSARQLARMVGMLSSCIPAVIPAPLHYHSLQLMKNQAVFRGGYNQQTTLPLSAQTELDWWCHFLVMNNGKPVRSPQPDLIIYTDASLLGWERPARVFR